MHVHVQLPVHQRVFVLARTVRVHVRRGVRVSLEELHAVVPSAHQRERGCWEEGVVLRRFAVSLREQRDAPHTVFVTADCLHVRIPHAFNTHALIEASIVAFKATKQLALQLVLRVRGSAIYPHDEPPKRLPPIAVRVRMFALEAGDDTIDSRLSLIYRAGADEQLMRMERARAFAARADPDDPGSAAARERLDALNASAWIRRVHNARAVREQRERDALAYIQHRAVHLREMTDANVPVRVLPRPADPPLVRVTMTQVYVDVSRPTGFALEETHAWLHAQAGNPERLPYTTLIPLHVRWRMTEATIRLRDYPLPLLHIPARDDGLPAWDAEGDLCIAEQLGDAYSVRHVPTTIVPAVAGTPAAERGLLVPKSAMSPKIYGPVTLCVSAQRPTVFAWGQAMQPAIQDVKAVFDAITSPPHDPSPKPGPWDKLPFQLQGRLHILFDGDVHLHLKSLRDPYQVTHGGDGWVLAWRRHVEVRLGFANADREFLQVRSGEHILAIPDLSCLADEAATGLYAVRRAPRAAAYAVVARPRHAWGDVPFRKVCWQLTAGVRWGMGLLVERTCTDATCTAEPRCCGAPFFRQCRFFGRIPHWQVRLRSFEGYARLPPAERGDSYAGWRSDFVHLSVSLQAIGGGEGTGAVGAQNNLYITPLAWDHFREWLRLFNSRLNLPIRQGRAFPRTPGVKSPKFGRHLGTIKYRFNLAALHVTHVYRQRIAYDLAQGVRTFVGVKARLSTAYVDLHQRMQQTIYPTADGAPPLTAFHKPLYEAEADVSDVEVHCVTARFREQHKPAPGLAPRDNARFDLFGDVVSDDAADDVPYDARDFVELDGPPLVDDDPQLRFLRVLTLARFNFHRRVESDQERMRRRPTAAAPAASAMDELDVERRASGSPESQAAPPKPAEAGSLAAFLSPAIVHREDAKALPGDTEAEAPGVLPPALNEPPAVPIQQHAVGPDDTPLRAPPLPPSLRHVVNHSKFGHEDTHTCLIGLSRGVMDQHLELEQRRLRHLEGDMAALASALHAQTIEPERFRAYRQRLASVQDAHKAIAEHCRLIEAQRAQRPAAQESLDQLHHALAIGALLDGDDVGNASRPLRAEWESFNNQILVYNPVATLTNATRDILLRYYGSWLAHRRVAQHLSMAMQRRIRHLFERAAAPTGADGADADDPMDLLGELVNETSRLAAQHTGLSHMFLADFGAESSDDHHPGDAISDDYALRKKHIALCLQPELVLHSTLGEHSTLVFHADQLRMRSYEVSDDQHATSKDSRTVLHRNYVAMQSLQCFHTDRDVASLGREQRLPPALLTGQRVPGFARLIRETHAFVHYDRHNRLRLHDPSRPVLAPERAGDAAVAYLAHHSDLLEALCPRFTLTMTREQYAAIYNVATDLLLYSDPLHKEREQQRDSLVYSHSFDNADFVIGMLTALQTHINDLLHLRATYEARFAQLNAAGRAEYVRISARVIELTTQLNLLEETVYMSHVGQRDKNKHFAWLGRAFTEAIEWNMIAGDAPPSAEPHAPPPEQGMLARLLLNGLSAARLALADGTSVNSTSLADLAARNAHPSAYFEEIVTKYAPAAPLAAAERRLFFTAAWLILAPVGGIPIVDRFDARLHPVRVQLEMRIGRQVMEYLFGTRRAQTHDEASKRHWLRRIVGMPRRRRTGASAAGGSAHADSDSDSLASDSGSDADATSPSAAPAFVTPYEHVWDEPEGEPFEVLKAEMLRRANAYVSFARVASAPTTICLSYKGEGDHSLTNMYDLEFQLPRLEYTHVLGSFGDLADLLKKDLVRIAWNHKSTLLKGVISSNSRKHAALKRLRANRLLKYGDTSEDVQRQFLGDDELAAAVAAATTSAGDDPERVATQQLDEPLADTPPLAEPLADAAMLADAPPNDAPASPSRWPRALAHRLHDAADDARSFVGRLHDDESGGPRDRFRRLLRRHKD